MAGLRAAKQDVALTLALADLAGAWGRNAPLAPDDAWFLEGLTYVLSTVGALLPLLAIVGIFPQPGLFQRAAGQGRHGDLVHGVLLAAGLDLEDARPADEPAVVLSVSDGSMT